MENFRERIIEVFSKSLRIDFKTVKSGKSHGLNLIIHIGNMYSFIILRYVNMVIEFVRASENRIRCDIGFLRHLKPMFGVFLMFSRGKKWNIGRKYVKLKLFKLF